MNLKQLPKIELHCHLDGSVRPETLLELAIKEGLDIKSRELEEFKKSVQVADECESLDEYLEKFDIANKVMQTKENLSRITFELMEDVHKNNVKYIEIRFAPLLHIHKGLEFDEIIEAVIQGMRKAEEKYDIYGNIILSCMRTMSVEEAFFVVREGAKFLGKGVVAVDLASSEKEGFAAEFKDPINLAKDLGYRITIHAGEAGSGQNVLDAIKELHAERIGHGVYTKDCPEAFELLKEKNITLEMCPTSNVQTKAVDSYETHPIRDYYNEGIKITVNTDNMTVSNTNLDKEYKIVNEKNNITEAELKQMYVQGIEASFASEDVKKHLRTFI